MRSELQLLYPPIVGNTPAVDVLQPRNSANEGVDIVAVHDLNEDLYEAWTDSRTGVLWLKDLLPQDALVARVLTFGYDGCPLSFFAQPRADPVTSTAINLVSYLRANREDAQCERRPIIFICHGLGGLVVKKALMYSKEKTKYPAHRDHSIFVCTTAILFFGTPHTDIKPAVWFQSRNIANLPREKHHRHISALQIINESFVRVGSSFRQLFFWEEIETHVGYSSAVPYGTEGSGCGIPTDHVNMVKFTALDSAGYPVVRNGLRRFCQEARARVEKRWAKSQVTLRDEWRDGIPLGDGPQMDKILANHISRLREMPPRRIFLLPKHHHLDPPEFIGREQERNILENAFFNSDCHQPDDTAKIFVVYGMGGSGKSELCSWFARHHKSQFNVVATVDATSAEHIEASLAELGEKWGLDATEKAGLHILEQLCEPFLLIVDNADDPQFKPWDLIPMNQYACVIITTRNLALCQIPKAGSLEVKGLKPNESLRLLLTCAGISKPWDQATLNLGNELCEVLGYLALALVVAGRSIQKNFYGSQLQRYLEFYNSKRSTYHSSHHGSHGMEVMVRDEKEKGIVYPAFEVSLAHLRKQGSQTCRDAIEILNMAAFYHRQHISLDIFAKAAQNRHPPPQGSTSIVMRMLQSFLDRFHPPPVVPGFLRSASPEKEVHRAREGISELASLSLINMDSTTAEFSLHPLVHAWARDRLGQGDQKVWARIAFNVLAETIKLPTGGENTLANEHADEKHNHDNFHRSLLPHLDSCLPLCTIDIADYDELLSRAQLYLSSYLSPTYLHILKEQAASMAKLAYVYGECGRFEESLRYLQKVKRLLCRSLGPDNSRTMTVKLELAKIYWSLGQLDEAIGLRKDVVNARERILGPSNKETLLAMDELGRSYWLNGQYGEALEQAEKTKTQMELTLGSDDRRTLSAMDMYGVVLQSWHRFSDSASIHRHVLQLREEKLGTNHLETLESKNNLAMALMNLKELEEAQALMDEVYNERRAQLGKEHPWTLWALCYLARIKVKTRHLDGAEQLLIGGIEAAKRSLPEDHLGVLMGKGELARVYSRQGRLGEAFNLLSHTLARLEETRGPEHPDSFYARWKLSILYQRQDKLDEAIETCQIAFQRAEKRLSKAHPLVSMIEADLEQFRAAREPQEQPDDNKPALTGEAIGPKRRFEFRTQTHTW
ncbi:hypothetical protein A1O7_09762 [Cladophialophora yegresii CBS 114405]|uniref:NB-ARC domain-containing protein n=1 Tax=Cladophialophora yegresii CBS 114405 TaxID=1182544 RepID=W9VG32_9EURO|nr:uncharacterized protein A1O7_09762 [Cladophialophora yegresii CBS 114405]EXJ54423.1 hypothetical protein A1O7_09762 [Cladophialophora yegresii CBS 114405]